VLPALTLSKHTGNSYCGTLYFGLQSILAEIAPEKLAGKRIGMFSYGSGLAATIFSLAAGDVSRVTDRSVDRAPQAACRSDAARVHRRARAAQRHVWQRAVQAQVDARTVQRHLCAA
jgi:3-hydroxy-3-methylglutaryl CoA synthase